MPVLIILGALALLLAGVVVVSTSRFNRQVEAEIAALFNAANAGPDRPFLAADLDGLPEPMRSYLRRCVKDGQPAIRSVRLKQTGQMRLKPEQAWMPFRAEQYYTPDPPAMLWRAWVKFMPLVQVVGRDTYARQQGHMLIKLFSTLPVVDARGPKIAVGAFVRLIAEFVWFPAALANNPRLRWEAVDARTVRATAADGDVQATLTYHFDAQGDLIRISSLDRYRDVNDARPTPWHVTMGGYREFGGLRIPAEAEVVWEPESGPFPWWRGTITAVEYNVPEQY